MWTSHNCCTTPLIQYLPSIHPPSYLLNGVAVVSMYRTLCECNVDLNMIDLGLCEETDPRNMQPRQKYSQSEEATVIATQLSIDNCMKMTTTDGASTAALFPLRTDCAQKHLPCLIIRIIMK